MSGKSKFFILFLPVSIIFLIVVNFYVNNESPIQNDSDVEITESHAFIKSKTRTIASKELSNNLSFALKKINEQENKTSKDKHSTTDYQSANQNIDHLKDLYSFKNQKASVSNFQKENSLIQKHVSLNKEIYNEVLNLKIQDALLSNDEQAINELFGIASVLPLGPSSLQRLAEELLLDMAANDRNWNEGLFRNTIQFYYIQNVITSKKNDSLIVNLTEKCSDEELKKKITSIDKEINIFNKNSEGDNEFHQ